MIKIFRIRGPVLCLLLGVAQFGNGSPVFGQFDGGSNLTVAQQNNQKGYEADLRGDKAEAVRLYKLACDGGDSFGCSNLGIQFHNGTGVAQSSQEAIRLYKLALKIDPNNAGAEQNLYLLGGLSQRQIEAAQAAAKRAADTAAAAQAAGFLNAEAGYAAHNRKDFAEAARLYQAACDDGWNSVGCGNLGILYHNGQGVPQNLDKARTLYQKALQIDPGNQSAKMNFSALQSHAEQNNSPGISADISKSRKNDVAALNLEDIDPNLKFYLNRFLEKNPNALRLNSWSGRDPSDNINGIDFFQAIGVEKNNYLERLFEHGTNPEDAYISRVRVQYSYDGWGPGFLYYWIGHCKKGRTWCDYYDDSKWESALVVSVTQNDKFVRAKFISMDENALYNRVSYCDLLGVNFSCYNPASNEVGKSGYIDMSTARKMSGWSSVIFQNVAYAKDHGYYARVQGENSKMFQTMLRALATPAKVDDGPGGCRADGVACQGERVDSNGNVVRQ